MEIPDIFFEIFNNLPRGGPGDNESTRKAFFLLRDLPERVHFLDIGCGPGMQTIELAKLINGQIIALDNHQPFLDKLNTEAKREGLEKKIKIVNNSMFLMDFKREQFDVIWSEGAVYIYGFEKALKDWRIFLKNEGYFIVSELAWIRDQPPQEIKEFFQEEYPPMKSNEENIQIIKDSNYDFVDSFILPESSWLNNYYIPYEKQVSILKKKYRNEKEKTSLLDSALIEIELFRKYSKYYGYVFYIMQNQDF